MMPTLSSVVAPQASWQPAVSPVMTIFVLQEFVFLVSYKRYDMDHTLMFQMTSHSLTLGWAMGYGVSVSIWRRLYYFTELMMEWIVKVIEAISNLCSDSPWWCNFDNMMLYLSINDTYWFTNFEENMLLGGQEVEFFVIDRFNFSQI